MSRSKSASLLAQARGRHQSGDQLFETVEVRELLRTCGAQLPADSPARLAGGPRPHRAACWPDARLRQADVVFTFEGLIRKTPFVSYVRELLDACCRPSSAARWTSSSPTTANDFYLLQCRPQSYSGDAVPVAIPQDLPADRVIFLGQPLTSPTAGCPRLRTLFMSISRATATCPTRTPCAMSDAPSAD